MDTTKLTGLSDLNIKALEETLSDRITAVTATTLTLEGRALDIRQALNIAMSGMPDRRHHPYASLHAVTRKLDKLVAVATQEERVEQTIVKEEITSEQTTVDSQALFLVGMHYPNMFEERRDSNNRYNGYTCKVCGAIVTREARQEHYEIHKQDKANLATTQIKERFKMAAAKPKTKTPLEQGVPAAYLNEDGSKFTPGADATYKSDAFKTILYHEHGFTDIDLTTRRVDIDLADAKRIVSERGWNDLFVKSLKAAEAKVARAAAKAADKASKVKEKAASKKAKASKAKAAPADAPADVATGDDVTPDPKPTSRARTPRGRKIGS